MKADAGRRQKCWDSISMLRDDSMFAVIPWVIAGSREKRCKKGEASGNEGFPWEDTDSW